MGSSRANYAQMLAGPPACTHSKVQQLRLLRVVYPAILTLFAVFLLARSPIRPWEFLFAALVVVGVLFFVTVAEVSADDKVLRYRRFGHWKQTSYSSIVLCKMSWLPATGRLKLDRFVAPWGQIYFAMPITGFEACWPGGHTKFTNWVNAKMRGGPTQLEEGHLEKRDDTRGGWKRCALLAGGGVFYSFLYHTLVFTPPAGRTWEGFPAAIRFLLHLEQIAFGWPWGLVACALLAVFVAREKFQNAAAWLASFFFGALLVSVLIQWLNRTIS